jgi:hypothetical protein
MPLEVIGLIFGIAAVAGVALMIGIRIAWRRQVEPLSPSVRRFTVGLLAAVAGAGFVLYLLIERFVTRAP